MKTVKQVSMLTGVSVRTLQYYDEIGLLKPSKVTEAGYRLYDDDSLRKLQQILFFKELDFSLKDIGHVMQNSDYDQIKVFQKQKALIALKRERLDGLIDLLDKLIKGEESMSFKEFDLSDYFKALEEFKISHSDEVIKGWGSIEEFDKMTEIMKEKEAEIAEQAVKQYGSVEKYTEAMKKNLENFSELSDKMDAIKANSEEYIRRNEEIMRKITSDLSRDIESLEIKELTEELVRFSNELSSDFDMGENYWNMMAEMYMENSKVIEVTDKKYGEGASVYFGRALKRYAV